MVSFFEFFFKQKKNENNFIIFKLIGNKYGNGLYTRDRGYGYEKHYAYDKELSTKAYGAEHSDKAANYGDHSKYDHSGLYSHGSAGHHKSGANKNYGASGHNQYGHNNGLYGKHYGASGKAYQLSKPYTHYVQSNYEPTNYPVYPAYKPSIYYKPEVYQQQQSYHDEPNHYEPTSIQSTYISHDQPQPSPTSYPAASTSYASNHLLHHPGVAYY